MSKKHRPSRRPRLTPAKQRLRRALQAERLEDRTLLNADFAPFQNQYFPSDTNNDGTLGSLDALMVINDLNRNGIRQLSTAGGTGAEAEGPQGATTNFVDVNGDGFATPADVKNVINDLNAEGETGPVMSVIARIFERPANYPTTPATNEITTIGVGQDFVVKLLVEDIRSMGTREGVFSAYVDVNFDNPEVASLVQSLPGVTHPQTGNPTPYLHNLNGGYGERAEPSSGDGLIDTDSNGSLDQLDFIGSFAGVLRGPGPGEFVLVEWAMTADAPGSLTIEAEPTTQTVAQDPNDAGESPLFDPGIFGQDAPVCPSQSATDPCMGDMEFVSDTITVVDRISAVPDNLNVNEDSPTITIDVLANDINNTQGPLTISNPLGTPSLGGTVVNNGNNITYTPAANAFGTETFNYTITNGLGDTSSATVTVDIAPINDGPINTVPGSQTVDEDNSLIFSPGVLSVVDVDADAGSGLQVNLGVGNGALTVGASGATVSGDGTGSVGISGSVAEVNAALNGLTYTPTLNFNGSDSLSVNTTDNGNFGSGGTLTDNDTVNITVTPINDAPVNTVPGSQVVFNTETLPFGSGDFSVSDVDASTLEVTLSVGQGTLQFGAGGTPSATVTATGAISTINSQLGSLIYDPLDSFVGADTLTMTTNDNGQTGNGGAMSDTDTVTIQVTPPELPFAAGDLFEVEEDSLTTNLDILGNDLKPDPQSSNTLSITQINGQTTTGSGQTFSTGNSGTVTFLGNSVSYLPASDFFGTDTFTYTIESSPDVGDGPSTGTVRIDVLPINDGPVNSVPSSSRSVDEDETLSFTGAATMLSIEDIDAGAAGVTVTLSVGNGTLDVGTGGGATVNNNGSGNVTIDGTVSQVNSSLGGLTYSPNANYFGSDQLTFNTSDNGNTGGVAGNPTASNPLADSDTVNITVQPINDAPTLVVPGNQTFITDFDNTLSAADGNAISIDDVDAGNDDVQVDLLIQDGALTITDTSSLSSVSGNGTSSVTLQGTVTNINSALGNGVTYRTSNSTDKTLNATVNDLGNNGGVPGDPGASNPLSATDDIAIEVLDFVPSSVGGFVFLDVNNDANKGSGETGLEGVKITLSGTTFRNEQVNMDKFTDHRGHYDFTDLEPGNYRLNQEQPANTKDGGESFQAPVQSAGNDQATVGIPIAGNVDSRFNNFAERGLASPFISMYDLVDSSYQRSGVLLSSNLGADAFSDWTTFLGRGWENFSNPRVDLLTMTMTVHENSSAQDRIVDLHAADHALHERTYLDRLVIRQEGQQQVIRVNGSAADFGLNGAGGEGEGEGDDLAAVDAAQASQYAQAADQIFGNMA